MIGRSEMNDIILNGMVFMYGQKIKTNIYNSYIILIGIRRFVMEEHSNGHC